MPAFYKYRAVEPWQFLLDILVNEQLYAARFESLNDSMEGVFTYSKDQENQGFIRELVKNQAKLGICSLSQTHCNTVMWSYYADGHKGLVLEVEIDSKQEAIVASSPVTYEKDISFKGFHGSDAQSEAIKILSKKLSAWNHEHEYRIFSRHKFVPVNLRRLYLGCKMPDHHQELIERLVNRINPEISVVPMKETDLDI